MKMEIMTSVSFVYTIESCDIVGGTSCCCHLGVGRVSDETIGTCPTVTCEDWDCKQGIVNKVTRDYTSSV